MDNGRYRASVRILVSLLTLASAVPSRAEEVPYGHRDFYPSPERPLGFRANGNGCFPGATPVTEWWDCSITIAGNTAKVVPSGPKAKANHVAWKVKVPGWSDTQPLIVGDRLVGVAEPDWVFCMDANTGEMLWQDRLLPLFLGPPPKGDAPSVCPYPPEEAWNKQQIVDIARAVTFMAQPVGKRAQGPVDAVYGERALARMREFRVVAESLDPDPDILKGFDEFIGAWERYLGGGEKEALGGQHGYAGYLLAPVMKRYRVAMNQIWPGDVGLVQSTPVTDGEFVYVAFGQGMIGCYDLDGNRRWAWRETEFELNGALYCDHTPSLLLADGVLLVRSHFGDMMGLDPATGAILHNVDIGNSYNHGAFSTPGVMRLVSPGGKKRTVLITQHNKVVDVKTGEILAEFPHLKSGDIGHGQPRMVWNNLTLIQSSQGVPPDGGPGMIMRVNLADDGTVTCEKLHTFGGRKFYNAPMAMTANGRLFGAGALWDLETGKPIPGTTATDTGRRGGSVIVGPYAFACVFSRRQADGWWYGTFDGYDLSAPDESKVLPGRRELAFREEPADINVDTWLPGLDKGRLAGNGLPFWFGLRNGGVVACGNRMFAQTATYMYCLGDPAVPYDWNSKSRPERIRAAFDSAAAARAKANPVSLLGSSRAWDRERGATAIRAMDGSRRGALAGELGELAAKREWPSFAESLELLRGMGKAGAAATPGLLKGVRSAIAANRPDHVEKLVPVIEAVSPGAQKGVVDDIRAALGGRDPATLITACHAAAALGAHAASCHVLVRPLLSHEDNRVCAAAAFALGAGGAEMASSVPALAGRLSSADSGAKVPLLNALRAAGPSAKTALDKMRALVSDPDASVAAAAARAIGGVGPDAQSAMPDLLAAFKRSEREVVMAAVEAALAVSPKKHGAIAEALTAVVARGDVTPACNAAMAIQRFGPAMDSGGRLFAVDGLVSALEKKPAQIKYHIIKALIVFGKEAEKAVPLLRVEANSVDCPGIAKEALDKIKPGAEKGPVMGGSDDLDIGL